MAIYLAGDLSLNVYILMEIMRKVIPFPLHSTSNFKFSKLHSRKLKSKHM